MRSFPTLSLIIDQRLTAFSFSAGSGSFVLLLISAYPELLDRLDPEPTLGSLKYSFVSWKEGSSSSDTSSNSCLSSDEAVVLHSRNQITSSQHTQRKLKAFNALEHVPLYFPRPRLEWIPDAPASRLASYQHQIRHMRDQTINRDHIYYEAYLKLP